MKKIFIILIGAALIAGVSSCKKDNINGDYKDLVGGSYLTLLESGNDELDWQNFAASEVSIKVGEYGSPVASVNVYAVLGSDLNPSSWHLVKNVPFSEGVELKVTGAELLTALGIDAQDVNTDVSLYPEAVTADGRKFSIANTPTSYQSFPAYNMAFIWTATLINYVCPFDQAYFNGNFAVQSDGWNDFAAGDLIAVQPGPGATQITLTLYPKPGVGSNRKNIIVDIDPATDSATVAKQVYGDYPGSPNLSVQGTGYVSACSGIISLDLEHSDAGGSYGVYTVVLKKP
jgi:hypothetical protein